MINFFFSIFIKSNRLFIYLLIIITTLEPKYCPSEPVVKTLEERCQKALYHVGCGLNCLQYFKNLNPQFTDEENMVCR